MISCGEIKSQRIDWQEKWDHLLEDYPEPEREDIKAALDFARESLDHTEIREAHA